VINLEARKSRQRAIAELLPERGLVVVVHGADHDLGPLLGRDTEYLWAGLAAVRRAMGR
jgi:hypothetical protein